MQLVRFCSILLGRGTRALGLVLVAATLAGLPVASASAACADADARPADIGGARTSAAVGCLTNEYRASRGLTALATDAAVGRAAQAHADDMAARGYYAHSTPEGAAFTSWLDGAGVNWQSAGENIARQDTTAREVVQAWIASPEHDANLTSPVFTQAGYAIAFSGTSAPVWVQEFVLPMAAAPAAPAAGAAPATGTAAADGAGTGDADDDGYDLAGAAREMAAKASARRSGRTLRVRVALPRQRAARARVTVVVTQRGRVVRRISAVQATGRTHRLSARLPRAVAGRAVVMVGTASAVAAFR